jgi:uncharacterized delta-60 repeat protein
MRSRFVDRAWSLVVTVGALLGVAPASVGAAPGDLDPTFSEDGRAHPSLLAETSLASPFVIEPDGGIIASRGSSFVADFSLVRLSPNGAVDPNYGEAGLATADFFGGGDEIRALARDSTGAVLAAGQAQLSLDTADAALARFLPDGSLDPSFGSGGMATLDLGESDGFHDVATGLDRSVIVLGSTFSGSAREYLIARFRRDGQLDPSFSGDGIQMLGELAGSGHDSATSLALGEDGSITIGVNLDFGSAAAQGFPGALRLTTSGTPDPGFAGDGLATLGVPAYAYSGPDVEAVAGGGVLVAGTLNQPPADDSQQGDVFAARLRADGELDPSFGAGGYGYAEVDGLPQEVDAEPRAGGGWAISATESERPYEFELVALAADGRIDSSFSHDGRVSTDVSGLGSMDFARGVEVDSQGRIVVIGDAEGRTPVRGRNLEGSSLVRYLDSPGRADADADGVPDRKDACPERYGDRRRGCLVFEVRRIRISYRPAIDDFRGSVYYAPAYRCSRGVVVKVLERRPGPDRLVGKSRKARNSEGKWEISALAPAGRYYARVVPRTVPEVGHCASGRSAAIRLGGRGKAA